MRIHDLKTGVSPVSMHQLEIYDALFCLEYHVKPNTIKHELRIYQNDDFLVEIPEPDLIQDIIDKIISSDKLINQIKQGEIE